MDQKDVRLLWDEHDYQLHHSSDPVTPVKSDELVKYQQNEVVKFQQNEEVVTLNYDLLKFVSDLFNKHEYSDIELILGSGMVLFGHKLVLGARNLSWGLEDFVNAESLDLSDFSCDVIYAMMLWVYTNEINFQSVEDIFIIELMKASSKYDLINLTNLCQEQLMFRVNKDNVDSILKDIMDEKAETLENYCNYFKQQMIEKNTRLLNNEDDQDSLEDDDVNVASENIFESTDILSDVQIESNCVEISTQASEAPITLKEGESVSCVTCDASFYTWELFQLHLKSHTNINPFDCKDCHESFATPGELEKHVKDVHEKRNFTCDICGKAFKTRNMLSSHKINHRPKDFQCEHCEKKFVSETKLKIHNRIHTGENPYPCDVCGRAFRNHSALKRHFYSHVVEKPHVCHLCGAGFNLKHSLNVHLKEHDKKRRKIKGVKVKGTKVRCEICGKDVYDKFVLNRHMLTHTGEKPHKCDICGKSFTQKSVLISHKLRHEKAETVKSIPKPERFECRQCERAYKNKSDLTKHYKKHHGVEFYNCPACRNTFSDREELLKHMQKHVKTGKLPAF